MMSSVRGRNRLDRFINMGGKRSALLISCHDEASQGVSGCLSRIDQSQYKRKPRQVALAGLKLSPFICYQTDSVAYTRYASRSLRT